MSKDSLATLPACLASLDFCGEIVVVDDYSNDGTWEFLARQGPRVRAFQRRLDTFACQRQALHEQVRTDWMLIVDADEEAMPGLAADIAAVVAAPKHAVYRVPMKNLLPPCWRHEVYYWNTQRRLLQTHQVNWPSTELVHAPAEYEGRTGRLGHGLLHHSYDSVYHLLRKQISYGRNKGRCMHVARRPVSALSMLTHATLTFIKYYLVKGMVRFGMGGLLAALAFSMETIVKHATAWELANQRMDPNALGQRDSVPLE